MQLYVSACTHTFDHRQVRLDLLNPRDKAPNQAERQAGFPQMYLKQRSRLRVMQASEPIVIRSPNAGMPEKLWPCGEEQEAASTSVPCRAMVGHFAKLMQECTAQGCRGIGINTRFNARAVQEPRARTLRFAILLYELS